MVLFKSNLFCNTYAVIFTFAQVGYILHTRCKVLPCETVFQQHPRLILILYTWSAWEVWPGGNRNDTATDHGSKPVWSTNLVILNTNMYLFRSRSVHNQGPIYRAYGGSWEARCPPHHFAKESETLKYSFMLCSDVFSNTKLYHRTPLL